MPIVKTHNVVSHNSTGCSWALTNRNPNDFLIVSCTSRAIHFWDVKTANCLWTIKSPSTLGGLAITPNGAYVVTGAYDDAVRVLSVPGKEEEPDPVEIWEPGVPTDIALSPDGRTLAVAAYGGRVCLWDIETTQLLHAQIGNRHDDDPLCLAFSPQDGKMLASSDKRGNLHLCDVKTGQEVYKFIDATDWTRFCTWSPAGDCLGSASDDSIIRIWKLGDKNENEPKPQALNHGGGYARGVAISPGSKRVVTCGDDETIGIWVPKEDSSGGWERKHTLRGHDDNVLSVLVSADSKQILSSGADRTIRIWDMETGEQLNEDSPIKTEQEISRIWLDDKFRTIS